MSKKLAIEFNNFAWDTARDSKIQDPSFISYEIIAYARTIAVRNAKS